MTYQIIHDSDGKPSMIQHGNTRIPLDSGNADFRAFLEWNETQKTPLDYVTSRLPEALPIVQTQPTVEERLSAMEKIVAKMATKA